MFKLKFRSVQPLKRFTVVLESSAATCFVYIAMVLRQPADLSKEVCLYVGADWLKLISQSEIGERTVMLLSSSETNERQCASEM